MPESQDDLFRGNRAWEALLEAHAVVDGWVDRVLSSPSGTNRRDDQGLHKRRKYLANRDMVAELFEGGVVGSKHKIVGLEDRTLDIPYTFFVSLLLDWPSVQRQLHAHADSGTDKAVRIRSANYRIESARSADAAAFVEDVILPLIQQMRPYSPPGEDGETEYTCAALLLFIDKLRKDNAWPTNDFALIRRSWVSDRINLASWVTAG